MEADERPSKKRRVTMEDSTTAGTNETPSVMSTKPSETTEDGANIVPHASQEEIDLEDADQLSVDDDLEALLPADEETELPVPSTTAPYASALLADPTQPPLSKNQQKKLLKKAEWESHREDRKALRKEKALAKRSRRREARQTQESENLALGIPAPEPKQKSPPQRPVTLPVTILIDCDFDDLMRDNERVSLAAQVTRSYSDNKNAAFRAHLGVCSFGGKLRERFEGVLGHYRMWRGVRFVEEGFVEAAEMAGGWMGDEKGGGELKGAFSGLGSVEEDGGDDAAVREMLKAEAEVVYLTSESEHTLDRLRPYSTYIIGGLVDKNREKGICYKRAMKAAVKTARLPIGEFMEMQGRKVLATNHVNEILVRWLECGDWGKAFLSVIPKRKGGKLRGAVEEEEDGEGAADADVEASADAEIERDASEHTDEVEEG